MPSTRTSAKPTRKRRRLRRPSPVTLLWGVVSLALAITLLIVQGMLMLIFTLLSVAVTALSAWADQRDDKPSVPTPRRDRPGSPSPRGKPRSTAAIPPCTNTGKPIDQCGCSARHVASSDGARRYKRAVGAPMGGKAPRRSDSKPAATSRPSSRKSDWHSAVNGTQCKTCKGSGAGADPTIRGGGACRTCRGFGKVA